MISSTSSVSIRRHIRWLPHPPSEPTHTLVLTGKSGVFVDVRFCKVSGQLDWAFAGYRHQVADDTVQFVHHIDSRTLEPLNVQDIGKNSVLETSQVLECGEMVNPETSQMTSYEELWEDVSLQPQHAAIFIKNKAGTRWQAQVENWQLGLGRKPNGTFWAWQAMKDSDTDGWKIIFSTELAKVVYLPVDIGICGRRELVVWDEDCWIVLDQH
ncbi:hypothetical protein CPC08DRAFT_635130 [Agrocybe pediades]|nr:hypothetical protein CPC08DRAFT_635130 [Agrocybe pediades]